MRNKVFFLRSYIIQENKNVKVDVDVYVGMKKAQKQQMIQDARSLEFSIHSYNPHSSSCI